MGALVFADAAVAGDIWFVSGRAELSCLKVVGSSVRHLYPNPKAAPKGSGPEYDRHVRLFGDVGQSRLKALKVGIIGLGGGGSLLNEWLSRLGVGHIIAVDPERLDYTNLPRVVGASRWDALWWFATSRSAFMRDLARRFAKHKVRIARRVARLANPDVDYQAIAGNVLDEETAQLLTDVDFLFLATDSIASRLVFNALVHQYLIPGFQIGVKVLKEPQTKEVGEITAVTRPVLPNVGGGCLKCQGAIPPGRVQNEALTEPERRRQRYVDDDTVEQPSVITLNVLSAAEAVNDVLFAVTGLLNDDVDLEQRIYYPRKRVAMRVAPRATSDCLDCGINVRSRKARGDRARLPCRQRDRAKARR